MAMSNATKCTFVLNTRIAQRLTETNTSANEWVRLAYW